MSIGRLFLGNPHPYSIAYNGTNTRISVTDAAALQPTSFSFGFWLFEVDSTGANFHVYAMKCTADTLNSGWGFTRNVGSIHGSLVFWIGAYNGTKAVTASLKTNQWIHVMGTYDLATAIGTLYIDGVSIGTMTSTTLTQTSAAMRIGAGVTVTNYPVLGYMTNQKYWSNALSAADVALEAANIPTNSATLIMNLATTEGTGTTVADTAGTYNGTLANGTWAAQSPAIARTQIA